MSTLDQYSYHLLHQSLPGIMALNEGRKKNELCLTLINEKFRQWNKPGRLDGNKTTIFIGNSAWTLHDIECEKKQEWAFQLVKLYGEIIYWEYEHLYNQEINI